ncbi:sensor histidine kinase [Colwellia psychrerythraea]|uniref:histidine kinase n=1 Tax=Colwellia psychrerythraea TaxID=28229 RepID=A0A099KWL2_COLPS|nr:HAMP domain-containing sensor histidine kinase [Colwellia psychrerythraea]KGJ94981.1 integral membrane sensor signal transduction histidine kinase [Colwellia psychrerythraea]
MKISLYQRLALTLCAAFIIMASLLVAWSNSLVQKSKYQAEQKLHVNLAEHLAHDNPLLQDGVYDKKALENLFHTLMLLGPAFEFYFLDAEGNILTYSADAAKIKRKSVSLIPLKQLIAKPEQVPVFGDDPRGFNNKKIFSASPVYQGELLQGYLYIIIGGEIYDSIFSQVQADKDLQKYGAFVIASLLLLLLVLLAVFHYFTNPVRELAKQMQALKAVQFDQTKIELKQWGSTTNPSINNNEVHFLGATFNDMVVQINQQFSLLTENDRMRRELLAHLSHDLRTPLATMQGYIETLAIKGNNLSDTEQQEYLATVQRNVSQLKRLIDQIFELAHLENGQVTVSLETFAIGELLHDILAKFTLKAADKNIALTLQPQPCQFIVYSDIAKLERIMTNLLENAIRHTDIGGEIVMTVTQLTSQVKVSVTDNGSGISKEDIAYIFDARYRASNAIEDNIQHTGLGLAISQKLSQVLNSELTVNSVLGNGSSFSLSLPTLKP